MSRRVGSTQCGQIAGLSKWGNQADVWWDLAHGIRPAPKKVFARGTKYEDVLRETYRREIGPCSDAPCTRFEPLLHPSWEFASASPDAFAGDLVVEFKTSSIWAAKNWGEPLTDNVPAVYVSQVAWLLAVTGRERAHLLVGFGQDSGDGEFFIAENRLYVFERDRALEELMRERVERFWVDHFLTGVPPSEAPIGAIKLAVKRHQKGVAKHGSIERELGEHLGRTSAAVESGVGAAPQGD